MGTVKKQFRSSSEKIRFAIEAQILSGKYEPGTRLDEKALAQQFGVSRTPVREAILKLEVAGLIERLPRRGSRVARINLHNLIMAFEFMSELEGMAARLAARRMNDAERAALAETHRESEKYFDAGDFERYYTLSNKFHALLIRGTHNDEIIPLANRLGARLIPFRRFQLRSPGRDVVNLRDHAEILQAVLNQDGERANELMRSHTSIQGDIIAEYVLQVGRISTSKPTND